VALILPLSGREIGRRFRRKAQHPYRSAMRVPPPQPTRCAAISRADVTALCSACDLFKVMRPTIFGLLTEAGHGAAAPCADFQRQRRLPKPPASADSDFASTPEATPKKPEGGDPSRPRRIGASAVACADG
jgi:hypothetical protein